METTPDDVAGTAMTTPPPEAAGVAVAQRQAAAATQYPPDVQRRNAPLSDEQLDAMLPATGFRIVAPPASYVPVRTAGQMATRAAAVGDGEYSMPGGVDAGTVLGAAGVAAGRAPEDLPFNSAEDYEQFSALLDGKDAAGMTPAEAKRRRVLELVLKIKNGTAPVRKVALRALTAQAREIGAGPIFETILPLLLSPTLEDQERHLLVKMIDRVMFRCAPCPCLCSACVASDTCLFVLVARPPPPVSSSAQPRRARPAVRAQDSAGHAAHVGGRRLLRAHRGARGDCQPRQGRGAARDDRRYARRL